jgi:hypothetical protein
MKTLQITIISMLAFILLFGCKQKTEKEQKAESTTDKTQPELISKWSTDSIMKIPESVCYDATEDVLYIANIQGKPSEKDGKGFISKVSPQGEVIDLEWVTGLDAPKGMGVYEGKLYVTNIDEIVEIDIAGGEIINRYPCKDAKFANDIAIRENGTVFASDMSGNVIYRLKEGKAEKWIDSDKLDKPNGLYTEKEHLLIGINGYVLKADYETGELTEFISNTGAIDGIEKVGDGYYIKSDWTGHVHLLHPEKEKILILDTADDKINAADIDFVPEKNMLYVPTFMDNRVMAYELKR